MRRHAEWKRYIPADKFNLMSPDFNPSSEASVGGDAADAAAFLANAMVVQFPSGAVAGFIGKGNSCSLSPTGFYLLSL